MGTYLESSDNYLQELDKILIEGSSQNSHA